MTDYAKKIIHRKREKIKENKQKKEIVSTKIKINVEKDVKTVKKGQKRANLSWHKSLPLGVCRSPTPKAATSALCSEVWGAAPPAAAAAPPARALPSGACRLRAAWAGRSARPMACARSVGACATAQGSGGACRRLLVLCGRLRSFAPDCHPATLSAKPLDLRFGAPLLLAAPNCKDATRSALRTLFSRSAPGALPRPFPPLCSPGKPSNGTGSASGPRPGLALGFVRARLAAVCWCFSVGFGVFAAAVPASTGWPRTGSRTCPGPLLSCVTSGCGLRGCSLDWGFSPVGRLRLVLFVRAIGKTLAAGLR